MFNNPYTQNYNQQNQFSNLDQNYLSMLDKEEERIKNLKNNYVNRYQQPAINQTFQLAPNNQSIKYANTINDVNKETVYSDTPFFSKDMTVLWIKTVKGDIKTYELSEIIPKDAKDMQIEYLQSQIEELKGMIKNDANVTNVTNAYAEQNTTNTSTNDESVRTATKKNKSTSISKVSGSKEK